jgi:GntR family transcriptional repressor for pyruvate dehydrogenase complex
MTLRSPRAKRYVEVAQHVRQLIDQGAFVPGSKLPSERDLAQQFAVGRSSVREALTALEGMGLIEVRHGSGAWVVTPLPTMPPTWLHSDYQSEREMLEARVAIECHNVQLAAQRATKDDLAALGRILYVMEGEDERGELGDETDLQFHLALADATHNRVLHQLTAALITFISQTLSDVRRKLVQTPANRQRLLDQHRHIFRAIAGGDAAKAAEIMEAHLVFVEHELSRFYAAEQHQALNDHKEAAPTT